MKRLKFEIRGQKQGIGTYVILPTRSPELRHYITTKDLHVYFSFEDEVRKELTVPIHDILEDVIDGVAEGIYIMTNSNNELAFLTPHDDFLVQWTYPEVQRI